MNWGAPGYRFAGVLLMGGFLLALAIQIALSIPVAAPELLVGDTIESALGQMTLSANDLMSEPGELESHQASFEFFDRQNQLALIGSVEPVNLVREGQLLPFVLVARQLATLPFLFWIQVIVGLGALIISGWIWALRSRDLPSGLFAASGFAVFISAIPSAIYTTRGFGVPAPTFRWLEELNALGAGLFGISMLALFLVYPRKLRAWKVWILGEALFFGVWLMLLALKRTPEMGGITLYIVTAMLAIIAAIVAQFIATRSSPEERASMTWLGLSVLVGAGAFVGLNSVPVLLGREPVNQGYAFLSFLVIYLGLAAGLLRYRLFEVGEWAFRFLFYVGGAVVLVLLDAALVLLIRMDRLPALGLSLLVIGLFYLPLRDAVSRFLNRRTRIELHVLMDEALHVTFAASAAERAERWTSVLKKFFDPLEVQSVGDEVKAVRIQDNGISLVVPAVMSAPALKLKYPFGGRSLFNKQSLQLASQIFTLVRQAEASRDAYDRGVSEERRRVAQDLHDDVGARLMTGLFNADESLKPTLQGAIDDIRMIVSGISGTKSPMGELVADLRYETEKRLSAAKLKLDWPLPSSEDAAISLEYRQHKALRSAVRETVSNMIRHSGGQILVVRIRFAGGKLILSLADDGQGFPSTALEGHSLGFGLKNLKERVLHLSGTCEFHNLYPGAEVRISFPV